MVIRWRRAVSFARVPAAWSTPRPPAGGDPIVEGVEFPKAADDAGVDAGTYALRVRQADGDTPLLEAPGTNRQAGTVYDVYAIGQAENGTAQLVVSTGTAAVRTGQMRTPVTRRSVVAVGVGPVVEAPRAATPATPTTSSGRRSTGDRRSMKPPRANACGGFVFREAGVGSRRDRGLGG